MATVALVKGQIMSEQQIMAEEMQSPKKVAFANRKYTNEERLKKEEWCLVFRVDQVGAYPLNFTQNI